MRRILLCLGLLLFSSEDLPITTWRISITTVDSRAGATFEDSLYKQYEGRLEVSSKITLPNGDIITREQLVVMGGPQTFLIRYPDGSIKTGKIVRETLYSGKARKTTRTRIYINDRVAKETTVTEYNLDLGEF